MPTYEYECSSCRFRFERKQRFDEEPVAMCPKCGSKSRRVIHSVPVIFKGSGFYTTDSRRAVPEPEKGEKESPGEGKKRGKQK